MIFGLRLSFILNPWARRVLTCRARPVEVDLSLVVRSPQPKSCLLTVVCTPTIKPERFPGITGHALLATTVMVAFKIGGAVSGMIGSGRDWLEERTIQSCPGFRPRSVTSEGEFPAASAVDHAGGEMDKVIHDAA